MSDNQDTSATSGPTGPEPTQPGPGTGTATLPPYPRPRLTRSRTDRKIAGVAGGLARHFDVDPLIIRVVLVVLALFGGSGLLLYGLGWLLIPDEGQERSEAERLLHNRGSGTSVPPLVIGVLGAVAVIGLLSYGPGRAALAVLVVVAVVMAVSSRNRREPGPAASYAPPPPAAQWQAPYATQRDPYGPPPPPASWGAAPAGGGWQPTPRPPRSPLGRITLSLAALVAGIVVAVQVAVDGEVHAVPVEAAALSVLGAGLVVGVAWGRARWLVLPASLLALALVVTANLPHIPPGGIGQRSYEPRSVAGLSTPYRLGIGELSLDLRDVHPAAGQTVRIVSEIGVGHLRVFVDPADRLTLTAHVDTGEVDVDGVSQQGRDVRVSRADPASAAGTIDLDLTAGIGQVEVLHATA